MTKNVATDKSTQQRHNGDNNNKNHASCQGNATIRKKRKLQYLAGDNGSLQ